MQVFDMADGAAGAAGLAAAAKAIAAGQLVGMPTETVYGLAADATNAEAVARIFAAKGRPRFNPLIVHVLSAEAAARIADLGEAGAMLAERLWPGPLTLVAPLRAGAGIADLVTVGLPSVAIRVPAHPVARDLLAAVGRPLAAPSANRSGHVSPTAAAHVVADLGEAVAVVLDAGAAAVGIESTIVAVDREPPALLRPGGVAREAIEAVLGRPLAAPGGGIEAPGMMASHYAPGVAVRLNATEVRAGESLLAFGPVPPSARRAVSVFNLSVRGDLTEAAARLFAGLRALEAAGAPIAAMAVPATGLGEAINDRLRRAAAPR